MKNLFYSIAVLLIAGIMQSICAQSWNYDGNAPTTERSIGTTSNQPFPIITNNNERMRIAVNGNVGIGTNNPLNLLDLNSSTASNVFQRFSNFTTGNGINNGFKVGIDNNGNALLANQSTLYDITMFNGPSRGLIIKGSNNGVSGYVGIGDLSYFNPQSLLHLCRDASEIYTQFTTTPTGYGANDGLKIGVFSTVNFPSGFGDPIAEVRNQENTALMLLSNNGERLRITQTGALNNGVTFNPGSLADNLTRIGISHNPSTPITRPLSLLHLGYNVDNPNSNDGWRPWMDVGTFTSQESDHVYLGLKPESNGADAVLSWGDNYFSDEAGTDNFRMIFTGTYNAGTPGLLPSRLSGVEAIRITPTLATGVYTGIGGDPISNLYLGNSPNPTATLEVNAWGATTAAGGSSGLRFTNLNSTSPTTANPGNGLLSVNANGDVIYVPCCAASNSVTLCGNPVAGYLSKWCGVGNGVVNSLLYDDSSKVGIGTASPQHKLDVRSNDSQVAIYGHADGSYDMSAGVLGESKNGILINVGVAGNLGDSTSAVQVAVLGTSEGSDVENFGVAGQCFGNKSANYAIYGYTPTTDTNFYAGYFDGNVHVTGTLTQASDIKLKSNVKVLSGPSALNIIHQLQPKSYQYNNSSFPSVNLPKGNQYGLIAQEVEAVLPELVKNAIQPSVRDKKGRTIYAQVSFKSINYIGFIPVLIGAVKEQQHTIDSLKEVINERLSSLENRLNRCCNGKSY
jgi:hypothetical protein